MQYKCYRYTGRKDPPKSIWREKERLHGWDDPAADPDPCVLVLFPEVVHWCPYSAIPWWGSISGMPLFGPSLRRVVRDWHGKLERKLALKWAGFGLESQVHSRIMGKSWTLPILSFFFFFHSPLHSAFCSFPKIHEIKSKFYFCHQLTKTQLLWVTISC